VDTKKDKRCDLGFRETGYIEISYKKAGAVETIKIPVNMSIKPDYEVARMLTTRATLIAVLLSSLASIAVFRTQRFSGWGIFELIIAGIFGIAAVVQLHNRKTGLTVLWTSLGTLFLLDANQLLFLVLVPIPITLIFSIYYFKRKPRETKISYSLPLVTCGVCFVAALIFYMFLPRSPSQKTNNPPINRIDRSETSKQPRETSKQPTISTKKEKVRSESDKNAIKNIYDTIPYEYEGDFDEVYKQIREFENFITKFPKSQYIPEALMNLAYLHIYAVQCDISRENKEIQIEKAKTCYVKMFAEYRNETWSKSAKELFDVLSINKINLTKNEIDYKSFAEIMNLHDNLFEQIPLHSKNYIKPKKKQMKSEDEYVSEIIENPDLIKYIDFISKYPLNENKNELITLLKSNDPNLPNEEYWPNIRKNDKGYWETKHKNLVWLVWIPPGKVRIWNTLSEEPREKTVEVNGFWIGIYEVSVELYKIYCAEKKITGINTNFENKEPIRNISWNEAADFCSWIGCRLPTEIEWIRAAKGETDYDYPWGEIYNSSLSNMNSNEVKEIETLYANGFGLYHVIGNVEEWCQDWYKKNIFVSTQDNLTKVLRGGSYLDPSTKGNLTYRNHMFPSYKKETYGFRVSKDE